MTNKSVIRKKRIIEIYFVLYLAALILLIPVREKININNGGNQTILQIPFSLKIEKTSLNAAYLLDSIGIRQINADTINNIFYTGNVKNVEYEFIIEDKNSNQNLVIKKDNSKEMQLFSYTQNKDDNTAQFKWIPNIRDRKDKSYVVTVIARATSIDSANMGMRVEDKLQFSINLNLEYSDDQSNFLISNIKSNDANSVNLTEGVVINNGNLLLLPREEIINTIAYSDWENEITVFGLNPAKDLRKQPEIIITREPNDKIGGNAKIAGYRENTLILNGESPGYGVMKVKVKLTRHSDGMEASKEIKIIPQLINEPDLSKRFYPGITYQIDPKLPIISGKTTYAELKDKDGKVLARSPNGGVFSWIPAISDTGKVMYLERYISGNLFGQKYPIKISNFQNPEIYRMVESGNNVIRIFTNSYGLVNKSPNYINFIEIIEGNIKVREIIGAQQAPDKENLLYKQVFEITPIDPSKIFKFKIRAISENGLKSDIRVYSKD